MEDKLMGTTEKELGAKAAVFENNKLLFEMIKPHLHHFVFEKMREFRDNPCYSTPQPNQEVIDRYNS